MSSGNRMEIDFREGFSSGKIPFRTDARSMKSRGEWVAQNSRSSSSVLNAGICSVFFFIKGSFFFCMSRDELTRILPPRIVYFQRMRI